MRSRSLWCGVLVERPLLLLVKVTLSGKGVSRRVMETGVIADGQILERVNGREGAETESVVK